VNPPFDPNSLTNSLLLEVSELLLELELELELELDLEEEDDEVDDEPYSVSSPSMSIPTLFGWVFGRPLVLEKVAVFVKELVAPFGWLFPGMLFG